LSGSAFRLCRIAASLKQIPEFNPELAFLCKYPSNAHRDRRDLDVPQPPRFSLSPDHDDDPRITDSPSEEVVLIDMMGFLEWSVSPSVRAALFSGIPANSEGREYAEGQMADHFLKVFLIRMGYMSSDGDAH
jgi:hypothetical protein